MTLFNIYVGGPILRCCFPSVFTSGGLSFDVAFNRPILTNNPLLSDSDRSEYRLRFAGVNMLGMCQYLLSAHDLIPC